MKIFIPLVICILTSFASYADIYKASNIKDIQNMAQDIFEKRNPEKTLFIFPLNDFIIRPTEPAIQQQDDNYLNLFNKIFKAAAQSKVFYAEELMLLDYRYEISNPAIVDLVNYIQKNKSSVIIITPNVTGKINKVDYFDVWTWNYLKNLNIDLAKGIFADKKILFNKELKKIGGTYPSFYKGLLSCNSDSKDNSFFQTISILFAEKLKHVPDVVVAVSPSKNYLETLETQLKLIRQDNEFFGILYVAPDSKTAEISPEHYFKFWQDFVKKLNKVTRGVVDVKESPYEE